MAINVDAENLKPKKINPNKNSDHMIIYDHISTLNNPVLLKSIEIPLIPPLTIENGTKNIPDAIESKTVPKSTKNIVLSVFLIFFFENICSINYFPPFEINSR